MLTFLVVAKGNLGKHAGREVAGYVEVPPIIQLDEMPVLANEIRNKVRAAVVEAQRAGTTIGQVTVELDATQPYELIVVGLADTMRREEKLDIVVKNLNAVERTNIEPAQ